MIIPKSASIAIGLLFLGSTASAVAQDFNDLCGSDLEGVTLAMSKDEVAATWTNRGYTLAQDSDDRKKPPNQPEQAQSLIFQTEDRLPNAEFIQTLGWQRDIATSRNKIYVSYAAPTDPAQLQAYEAFYRSKLVEYCEHDIDALRAAAPPPLENSRFSRMNPNPVPRTQEFCENALQGQFRETDNGHAVVPPNALHVTDAQGCFFSNGALNLRGFTSAFRIGIESPR